MTPANQAEYGRYREIFKGIRLPLAFVDLDKFDRNIAYVASTQKFTGKTIRVHSKSLRCATLIKRIFKQGGDRYRGVMTFSVEETAYLAEQGMDDFIVAYPTVQPSDLDLMIKLTQAGKTVSLMIDSVDHLNILSAAGEKAGTVLHACLEIDLAYRPLKSAVHMGVRRSPIRSVEEAVAIAAASQKLKGAAIDAVMGYEAHIAGPNDDIPGKWWQNQIVRRLKKASIREFTPRRRDIARELRTAGLTLRLVNGGGYVASGPAGRDKLPVPVYPKGLRLLPLEGAGEVQTPFMLPDDVPSLDLGDPVFLQHAKGGELAERFNEFYLVQRDKVVAKVRTYRGDGQAFI